MMHTGRKLYTFIHKMADDRRLAVDYALVNAWAHDLNRRDWYTWVPGAVGGEREGPAISKAEVGSAGHQTAQQTTAMREVGPTKPDYLADPLVQMTATIKGMQGLTLRFWRLIHRCP